MTEWHYLGSVPAVYDDDNGHFYVNIIVYSLWIIANNLLVSDHDTVGSTMKEFLSVFGQVYHQTT